MKKTILAVLVAMVVAFVGCADRGPTDQEIKKLFLDYFVKKSMVVWKSSARGKIKNIEIVNVQRGKSIKKNNGGRLPDLYAMEVEDCWPVKLHVKGEAEQRGFMGKIIKYEFDDQPDFILCKRLDGSWMFE